MLPNAARAFVEPAKVRDDLLCPSHAVGRFKATGFAALGYTQADWERLRDDLLRHGATGEVHLAEASKFGQKYLVRGTPTGPIGRSGRFVSVWLIESEASTPRFITAYPE